METFVVNLMLSQNFNSKSTKKINKLASLRATLVSKLCRVSQSVLCWPGHPIYISMLWPIQLSARYWYQGEKAEPNIQVGPRSIFVPTRLGCWWSVGDLIWPAGQETQPLEFTKLYHTSFHWLDQGAKQCTALDQGAGPILNVSCRKVVEQHIRALQPGAVAVVGSGVDTPHTNTSPQQALRVF